MICRALIELTFGAFSIERWNDHPRTLCMTEMDKQAHKAMIAWALARRHEDAGGAVNWKTLIEGGLFEFYRRAVLTDLKPPIFHKLMAHKEQKDLLNHWVLEQVRPSVEKLDPGLTARMEDWILEDRDCMEATALERNILEAAHFLASRWEFKFIEPLSRPLHDTAFIKEQLDEQVRRYSDLPGVADSLDESSDLAKFFNLVGQLRFQRRWAQTPRIPATSVLGHLLMVAHLAFYISIELAAGETRRRNNFYCGLWHDLPEVLTRDIISPVKRSVKGLEALIKDLEEQAMENTIYPLLPPRWAEELRNYTVDEFENRYQHGGRTVTVKGELTPGHDDPQYNAIDGKVVEVCDKLAAYIEASTSISLGVAPAALVDGKKRLEAKFADETIGTFHLCQLFDLFR